MSEHPVDVEILDDIETTADRAAAIVVDRLRARPALTLGLATGSTMNPVYDRLAAANRAGVSFAGSASFNLDEYLGLAAGHPASFRAYMLTHFLGSVDLPASRAHIPDGAASDPDREAARYECMIAAAGGIDLQLLGIGANGHVGFNEPGSAFASRTRVVTLTAQTRAANASAFPPGEPVPGRAITMGIATILDARELLLIATGAEKADAIAAAVEGAVAIDCPASALRLHSRARIVCDAAAGARLRRAGRTRRAG